MRIALVTLFPEMFEAISQYGITGRAVEKGLLELQSFNPRAHTSDRHQTVDDRPYGGGPGMLMMVQPLRDAIHQAKAWAGESGPTLVVYLSPQGSVLQQSAVQAFAEQASTEGQNLVLLAGRYEGVDERLLQAEVDAEWSIGDYVLSGGELAAMVMVDAITRLLPGALGHALSAQQDSFSDGLLDCPHYTRPEEYEGSVVPPVLLSGNHEKIRQWRLKQAVGRTWQRRPELLDKIQLNEEQLRLLAEFKADLEAN